MPSITPLELVNSSIFTLNCSSQVTPATFVIWRKDNQVISEATEEQILRDGASSTYDNLISIDSTPNDIIGTYTCSVLNSAGQSNAESLTIQGMVLIVASGSKVYASKWRQKILVVNLQTIEDLGRILVGSFLASILSLLYTYMHFDS